MPNYKDYYSDGASIYRQSSIRLHEACNFTLLDDSHLVPIASRMVHACADDDIVAHIKASPNFYDVAREALCQSRYIITDSMMVYHGVITRFMGEYQQLLCMIKHAELPELAKHNIMTLSAAQIDLWRPYIADATIIIGNAPTSLYRLMDVMMEEKLYPKLLIATPVGFVGAVEAKEVCYAHIKANTWPMPCLTLLGRKGGSAIAASAINALYSNGNMEA